MRKVYLKLFALIFSAVIFVLCVISLLFPAFEKEPPKVEFGAEVWNLRGELEIEISDNSAIKSYEVFMKSNEGLKPLNTRIIDTQSSSLGLKVAKIAISAPQDLAPNIGTLELIVRARDTSLWNFTRGNLAQVQKSIVLDTKRPKIAIISASPTITQGGSALIIFYANDRNFSRLFISNGVDKFGAKPMYRDGFYAALVAWPKNNRSFSLSIYADDLAGNSTQLPVPINARARGYRISNITLSDEFLESKVRPIVEELGGLGAGASGVEAFLYLNENVRKSEAQRIKEVNSAAFATDPNAPWEFAPNVFAPMRNAAHMAAFGDSRRFFYNNKMISTSQHMGTDLASVQNAPIIASNGGRVILSEFLGITGNTMVIYHGLGLSTLYAHLSETSFSAGDIIAASDTLGLSGNSGFSMGDHLHFGVLVQGHEVRTAEWMDGEWLEKNIYNVLNEAIALINIIPAESLE